jgi:hypothetical protein
MTLWDDVKSNLTEWYGVAADKTGELAKVGLRRYDIFGLSRDIERQFSEIGSLVYNALGEGRRDVLDDPALLALVDRVRELEQDLQAKEREIAEIRTAAGQRQAARSATAETAAAAEAEAGAETGSESPPPGGSAEAGEAADGAEDETG